MVLSLPLYPSCASSCSSAIRSQLYILHGTRSTLPARRPWHCTFQLSQNNGRPNVQHAVLSQSTQAMTWSPSLLIIVLNDPADT